MGRCIYNKEWEGDHPWLAPVPSHPHDAKCKLCQKVFSIAGQGIGQVRSHGKSSKHQTLTKNSVPCPRLDEFFKSDSSSSGDAAKPSQPSGKALQPQAVNIVHQQGLACSCASDLFEYGDTF